MHLFVNINPQKLDINLNDKNTDFYRGKKGRKIFIYMYEVTKT
jgi:hypothetical protein